LRLRSPSENDRPIQTIPNNILASHIPRLNNLCRRSDARRIEARKRADMTEQVAKLCTILHNLIFRQRQPRQLRNIPNINRFRSHNAESFEARPPQPAPTNIVPPPKTA